MRNFFVSLKNVFLYNGLQKSQHENIKNDINEYNKLMLYKILVSSIIVFSFFSILSIFFNYFSVCNYCYFGATIISSILFVIVKFVKLKNLNIYTYLSMFWIFMFVSFSIFFAVNPLNISDRTTLFLVFPLLGPMFFCIPTFVFFIETIILDVIYLFLIYNLQRTYPIFFVNVINSTITTLMTIIAGCASTVFKARSIYHAFENLRTDEFKKLNNELKEQNDIAYALTMVYKNVYKADLLKDSMTVFENRHEEVKGVEALNSKRFYSYKNVMENYINVRVFEEDKDIVKAYFDVENLKSIIGTKGEYEFTYRVNFNEEFHHIQVRFVLINKNQKHFRVIFGFRIIDDVIEEEHKHQQALQEALEIAKKANKSKTVFLNNMSHDIRTPMNAIIGFTNLAMIHLDKKDLVKEYLKKINVSSNHLLNLINDVLDMSRIESGKVKFEETPIHILTLLDDLKDIVQADVSSKNIKFSINSIGIKNENIICDRLRLNQILLNILSNAIKFTNENGNIDFTIFQKVQTQEDFADFEFRIKDDGIGMSQEFQSHIFEPFTREQTSTVSGIQGTGLGMAITKNIIDMLNGKIEVESKEGGGTEFIVSLTFKIAKNGIESKKFEENLLNSKYSKGKKILVVEDNELNQEIIGTILEELGFRIDFANDGQIAVEKFKNAQTNEFSLILMDIQMPNMDGYEATRQIRSFKNLKKSKIPIIAMTANAFEEDKKQALESGMNCYITKPIEIDKLKDALSIIFK